MKKTLLLFVFAAGLMMPLSSCLSLLFTKTHTLAVDENVPAARSATITFVNETDGYFFIKKWNNKDISKALYGEELKWSSKDKAVLTVPAGNNSFTFDMRFSYSSRSGTDTYRFEDIELRQNLEPGKEYRIKGKYQLIGLGLVGFEFFVEMYDITNRSTLLNEWKIGEHNFWEK